MGCKKVIEKSRQQGMVIAIESRNPGDSLSRDFMFPGFHTHGTLLMAGRPVFMSTA